MYSIIKTMEISSHDNPEISAAPAHLDQWSLVVATNDEQVLTQTLLASPAIDAKCQVIVKPGFCSAGEAYNSGLKEAQHEIIVFAHQDVYLPESWLAQLGEVLEGLAEFDSDWGVLGVFGVARETGARTGYCYSTGLKKIIGEPFRNPILAESLDELVLIVRKSSGLTFDSRLPGFHLYGTDLCLQAESRGMNNYIVPAFCIHNSNGLKYYPQQYWRSYLSMRAKWRLRLPVTTSCVTLSRSFLPMLRQIRYDCWRRWVKRPQVGSRCSNVSELYRNLCRENEGL